MTRPRRHVVAAQRLLVATAAGLVGGAVVGALVGWVAAPATFWFVGAGCWIVLSWTAIWRMDAASTARWATREDPTIGVTHLILLVASLASLGGVGLLLGLAGDAARLAAGLLGAGSVLASWAMVHTLYTLGYAAQYYAGEDGGIDFNQREPPAYADFAYFGFTLGMTYQVSDTTISDPAIRRSALKHALLSYFLGAVVLAVAVNTVAGLVA